MPFDGADLCIILGNLLDNAMEAVGSLPEGERQIDLSVSQVKRSLSITVRNPYQGKIRTDENGQIVTGRTAGTMG